MNINDYGYDTTSRPVTIELLDKIIDKYYKDRYLIVYGYDGSADSGNEALYLNEVLNYMYEKGYEFIDRKRNPVYSSFVLNTEWVFRKI